MRSMTGLFVALSLAWLPGAALSQGAEACEDGQILAPGQACVVTVKWGHDHVVTADFAQNGSNAVRFEHVEGKCNVALFGPLEGQLSPEAADVESALPGDHHLLTRAITVANEACRYRVRVE